MARGTRFAASVIGREVLDQDGRRLGRIVAIIHKSAGVDVLVSGHRWLRRRTYRLEGDLLSMRDDGRLSVTNLNVVGRRNRSSVVARR